MTRGSQYRALVCITTCRRLGYLRRCLPHVARFASRDARFSLIVSLDGRDMDTVRFCDEWEISLVYSEEPEGVGLSKNRVLERFPDFDYYFFLEDDVEVVDGEVFPAHVELSRASGIHHFSLFERRGLRKVTGESTVAGTEVLHGLYGGGDFAFYTGDGLQRVGGWHPRFAQYRRWGHTEHSYRFVRAGLAPAPFNVAPKWFRAFIWHSPPSVTRIPEIQPDADQIAPPERELMDEKLRFVAVQTLSPHHFNGVPLGAGDRLGALLDDGDRYPLASAAERRECWSDYHLWRSLWAANGARRAASLAQAAWLWPGNPAIRHYVKTALRG